MTQCEISMKLEEFVRRGGLQRLVLVLLLCVAPVLASGPGPNGVNIGFDFNWNNGPLGYTASFIASTSNSGGTLNNCGAISSSASACDFVFAYSIGGVSQPGVVSGGVYDTWPASAVCNQNPSQSSPLTLFNCFNQNSFGQIFLAGTSGQLTAFSMNMTCLNPTGTPPTGLVAALYQVNPSEGGSIPATPIATTPVNLSSCPTLTSWTGHTFSGSDFAAIPMNFSGASLTAGTFYAVYFGGLVPGAPLPGSPTVTSVAPNSGPVTGGNTVTITGTNLTGATSVTFGGTAATSFTVVSSTSITAVVPTGVATGSVGVIVVTPNGSNTVNTLYSYSIAAPTVTSVTPNSGPPSGGNTVTISGTGFTGATSVTFGGAASTNFTVVNDTTITATVPPGTSGTASVIVTAPGGSNAANMLYNYVIMTPTLGESGMIGLGALLVLYACFKLRRDQRFKTS